MGPRVFGGRVGAVQQHCRVPLSGMALRHGVCRMCTCVVVRVSCLQLVRHTACMTIMRPAGAGPAQGRGCGSGSSGGAAGPTGARGRRRRRRCRGSRGRCCGAARGMTVQSSAARSTDPACVGGTGWDGRRAPGRWSRGGQAVCLVQCGGARCAAAAAGRLVWCTIRHNTTPRRWVGGAGSPTHRGWLSEQVRGCQLLCCPVSHGRLATVARPGDARSHQRNMRHHPAMYIAAFCF